VNTTALADLIGATHVMNENTVGPWVRQNIRVLARMLVYEQSKIDKMIETGALTSVMEREVKVLRFALRVLTHEDVQGVAYAQAFEARSDSARTVVQGAEEDSV